MIRFGLCCIFREQPIKFRRTTATYLSKFNRREQLARLSALCLTNADSLMKSLAFCNENGIGGFRINSQILPLKTHPDIGYDIEDLPDAGQIIDRFQACGRFSGKSTIRTTFHPDQFITLSSPRPDVIERSIADLAYQAQVAEWVGADVINIHAGGVHGDKPGTLMRLQKNIDRLPAPIRQRLTLENDDKSYSPEDLLPVCAKLGVPMVYDVHHHRCCQDGLSIEDASRLAMETWDREPLFHISSPANGWQAPNSRGHHDYINVDDFPLVWKSMDITIEVEAKAKELAVLKLMSDLRRL
ncbi:UV DNA damage endonuclease [Desulfoluna limicola]|uniref:UV DNA damage endonuclease n=1 Tax=Desulfoluna limicola TaxID=2810562 RepID=A0ABM7PJ33_9BACT|nr:UV DNA damage repair endonuclease UvsE [Desulfoluna limicola]BCS97401.1 UV DNA damage endonuclease [Desulfoluna limicola]